MGLDDFAPVAALVVQHPTSRRCITPATARSRNACRGFGHQLLSKLDQPGVQQHIAKINCRELFFGQLIRLDPHQIIDLEKIAEIICNEMTLTALTGRTKKWTYSRSSRPSVDVAFTKRWC